MRKAKIFVMLVGILVLLTLFGQTTLALDDSINNTNEMNSVVYGNGRYAAVGDNGALLTSNNGYDWTESGIRLNGSMDYKNLKIAYGNGKFVLLIEIGKEIGNPYDRYVLTSTNLEDWSLVLPNNKFSGSLIYNNVIWTNSRFVLTGLSDSISSSDGVNWEDFGNHLNIRNIIWNGNSYIGLFSTGLDRLFPIINYSSDFKDYNYAKINSYSGSTDSYTLKTMFTSIAQNDSKTIVLAGTRIAFSNDNGTSWDVLNEKFNYASVAYGKGKFVAITNDGKNAIKTSIDGVKWNSVPFPSDTTDHINEVSYCNNMFVAVGTGGLLITSEDGSIWSDRKYEHQKKLEEERISAEKAAADEKAKVEAEKAAADEKAKVKAEAKAAATAKAKETLNTKLKSTKLANELKVAKKMIGKNYWIHKRVMNYYKISTKTIYTKTTVKNALIKNGKVVLTINAYNKNYYNVTSAIIDGITYSSIILDFYNVLYEDPHKHFKWSNSTWSKIESKAVWIGMTPDMAYITLGNPDYVNRTVTSKTTHEQWVYTKFTKDIYLYFDNGKCTGWQE